MKTHINIFISLFLVTGILAISSCGDDDELNPVDRNTNILTSHSWKLSSLKIDNIDKTSLYTGLTITFTGTGFNSNNGEPVWPVSGTWSFLDVEGLIITRSDGVQLTLQSISQSQIVFSLPWSKTTFDAGRINSISGNHVFAMVPL